MSEAQQSREPQGDKDGRLLAGRYRLGEVLGRGGMGTVWRAVDETLGRTVAVKELRFPSSIDEDEKRRLITRTLREAKAIARIRNTSAVTVYDVVDEDDRPWIVMELIEGKSLAEVIREDGTLTPRRAAEVGLAILDVLRSAHREGILHRDVKPSNVLISEDGRVVLTDFGIAQVEGDPSVTSTGMLVGAPSYISPERARGHKPGPPADLWSLGGLLYASVEGRPPYDKGSAIATLTAVMTEPVEPPANAGGLEEVIYGLLAKEPDERLDDAGARVLLNAVINAPEKPAVPRPNAPRSWRCPRSVTPRRAARAARRTPGAVAGRLPRPVPPRASEPLPPQVPGARQPPSPPRAGPRRGSHVRHPVRGRRRDRRGHPRPAPRRTEVRTEREVPGRGRCYPAHHGRHGIGVRRRRRAGQAGPRASITDVVPRRTLAVIAGVVVLAVLGTVLALTLGDDGAGDQGGSKGGDTAASSGATAGDDTQASTGAARARTRATARRTAARRARGRVRARPPADPPPRRRPASRAPTRTRCPPATRRSPTSGSTSRWRCPRVSSATP